MRKILLSLLCLALLAVSSVYADESRFPKTYFAPYVSRYPAAALTKLAEDTGIRYFTLAFILNGGKCSARWNGSTPLDMPFLHKDLEGLRAMGGDIIVSFGGYAGVELAEACTDVEALTAQYQAVIDLYDLTHVDFDIEGARMRNLEEVERRSKAIAALQPAGEDLVISYTLPVAPDGLTEEGIQVLQSAIDHGIEVDVVNVMTMNFGWDSAPEQMGEHTIMAAESLFEQLKALYPEKTDEELWGMIGLTPMIGLNDVHPEIFTLEDAQQITDFAIEKGIRMIAMWSLDRDQTCISRVKIVDSKCSGIDQQPFDFAKIFNTLTPEIE
jgi:hypothetical protein